MMKSPPRRTRRRKTIRQTGDEASAASGRLLALKKKYHGGWFWFTSSPNFNRSYYATTCTKDVLACAGSALNQDQTKGRRLPVAYEVECPLSAKECCQSEPCKFPGKVRRALAKVKGSRKRGRR